MSHADVPDLTQLATAKTQCAVCKENSMAVEAIKRDLFGDGGVIERVCTNCRFFATEVVSNF